MREKVSPGTIHDFGCTHKRAAECPASAAACRRRARLSREAARGCGGLQLPTLLKKAKGQERGAKS